MIIVYVDDDRDDVDIFCDALRTVNQAIRCMIARDGEEALTLLEHTPVKPNFIFLDINMPVMNGKECLVELKRRQELKNIPVIMYSTTTSSAERAQCFKMGAHKFLIKHDSYAKLCKELEEIICTVPD
jgi:CheY-like chemotaxis protein